MSVLTMVQTRMPRYQSTGLLASGTLSSAILSLLRDATGTRVFFNGTANGEDGCFVWHGLVSFQQAACLRAYSCTRNRRYEVNEDEYLPLLQGILSNKIARKWKQCNNTNDGPRAFQKFLVIPVACGDREDLENLQRQSLCKKGTFEKP